MEAKKAIAPPHPNPLPPWRRGRGGHQSAAVIGRLMGGVRGCPDGRRKETISQQWVATTPRCELEARGVVVVYG